MFIKFKLNKKVQIVIEKVVRNSGDIIDKHERGGNLLSIDVATKVTKISDTTTGYILEETEHANIFKYSTMLNRFNNIEKLDPENKKHLLSVVDNFI